MIIFAFRALCSQSFLQEKNAKTIFRNQFLDKKNVQNVIGATEFGFFFAEKRINGQKNLKSDAIIIY